MENIELEDLLTLNNNYDESDGTKTPPQENNDINNLIKLNLNLNLNRSKDLNYNESFDNMNINNDYN